MTGDDPRAEVRAEREASAGTVEEIIRQRLSAALGGWRGSLETALPTVAFVIGWTATRDLRTSLVSAAAIVLVLALVRLARRETLQYVAGAAFATAVAAFFAYRSGRAEAAFLPGIITNAAYAVGSLLSVIGRWPMVGFLVGAGDPLAKEDPMRWRRDPALVAVCSRLTLVMTAMFTLRVAIMYPLYLLGNIAALGTAKIALGWPLWVAALAIMGTMLAKGSTPHTAPARD